jgi:hypothetical protein
MAYSSPAGTVVYEEDPATVPALLAQSGYVAVPANLQPPNGLKGAAFDPDCWNKLLAASGPSAPPAGGAVVFSHERVSPAGNHRLVIVLYCPRQIWFGVSQFAVPFSPWYVLTVTPATLNQPAGWYRPSIDIMYVPPRYAPKKPPVVRIYAGQPDPNDASHFTIAYQMWGQSDTIDGRLLDNDSVTMTPRHPPQE